MTEEHKAKPIPIFDVGKWSIRMAVAAAFGLALLVFADPARRPGWVLPGAILVAAGCLLRIWGTGHLSKNKVLATGGPYAFVRHPLYVGTLLILVGLSLMAGSDVALYGLLPAGILIYLLYYAPKKERVESDRLRRRFGEKFDRYRAAVRGYVPRITPYPDREGRWSLSGVLRNREYLITLAVAIGVAVLLAKRHGYLGTF